MRRQFLRLFLLLVVALAAQRAAADKITLSNGRVIEGRILSRDASRVTIESGGMISKLSASSIQSIEKSAEYTNTLLGAETAFRRREPLKGFDALFSAQKQGAPTAELRRSIEQSSQGIRGGIENAREQDKPALRRSLRQLLEGDLLTTRTLFLTAQNFHRLDDWDSTAEALDRIAPDAIAADPMARKWTLDFMRGLVKRQLARGDFETAIGYVERMRRITNDEADPQIPLAQLTRSAAARDRKDFTLAFSIIARDLAPQVPEIARNRAIYTIEELKRWAADTKRFHDARESLFPIQRLFPVESAAAETHLLALEGADHLVNGRSLEALVLLKEVPEDRRSPEIDRLYNQSFHLEEMKRLEKGDPLELFKHGRWCTRNGLLTEAVDIFNKTRENPNLRDMSNEMLTNTRRNRDTLLLEEAQNYMKYGNIQEVLSRTQVILANPDVGSALNAEAKRLEDLAKSSMKRETEARPYQAEAFFQQAERAYFQQVSPNRSASSA